MSGYLFVINNYAPMIICLIGTVISLVISFGFKDIYLVDKKKRKTVGNFAKEYKTDIVDSLKFIKRSNRMKSYLLFAAVFYALINIFDTYKFDLLTEVNIGEEESKYGFIPSFDELKKVLDEIKDLNNIIITDNLESICFTKKEVPIPQKCIKCGSCYRHCPKGIDPCKIINNKSDKSNTSSCLNCGLCNYICPSFINLRRAVREDKK